MTDASGPPGYTPIMIRDLPDDEKPRERLIAYGPSALSIAELLAIILRVGVTGMSVVTLAQHLLRQFDGLAGLHRASVQEIAAQVRGLGPAKAAQIKAALELGRRLQLASAGERPQVKSPADAAAILMPDMALLEQEHLRLLILDTKNFVIASPTVYKGSLNSSIVRVGELFREAIKVNAAALIVAHNHPSGDPSPSPEDIRVTREIVQAGKLLDIEVLDHLVIGHQRFVSLKERGLGFV